MHTISGAPSFISYPFPISLADSFVVDHWTMLHCTSAVQFYFETKSVAEVQLRLDIILMLIMIKVRFHLVIWYWCGWVNLKMASLSFSSTISVTTLFHQFQAISNLKHASQFSTTLYFWTLKLFFHKCNNSAFSFVPV